MLLDGKIRKMTIASSSRGMWTSEWPERPVMEIGKKEGVDDGLSSRMMKSLHLHS